jgi:DNA-directed RNA polymerase specialized sigma24 family protein
MLESNTCNLATSAIPSPWEGTMSVGAERSVTRWIESLKAGEGDADQRLWQRYFEALVRLARDRLRGAPKGAADEEDAALSAFDSFCRGAAGRRYPRLDDRHDLWRLLVVITERKALDQARRQRRLKRGGGRIRGISEPADDDVEGRGISGHPSPEPTPEFAALVADECRVLLGRLGDDSLRAVARLRMEGYTNEEISERLGCSLRTVARKIELIRRTWSGEGGSDDER